MHAAEQERPDVAAARITRRERQGELSPERLVFIDETGATTNWRVAIAGLPAGNASR